MDDTSTKDLRASLARYVNDAFGTPGSPDAVSPDDELLESGLVDSLGVMSLVHFIEQSFDLAVPPGDVTIDNFRSVNRIVAYVEARVA